MVRSFVLFSAGLLLGLLTHHLLQPPTPIVITDKKFSNALGMAVYDLGDPGCQSGGKVYIKDIDWDGLSKALLYYLRNRGEHSPILIIEDNNE